MTVQARRVGAAWGGGTAVLADMLRRAFAWPMRIYRARALLHQLARLDVHELRDIGLTPGDLRDAAALPIDADPSPTLRRRAEERRRRR